MERAPWSPVPHNLFIYQAIEFSLDPVGFLIAQFLQRLWLLKPLFWRWEIGWCFSSLISGWKDMCREPWKDEERRCFHFTLSPASNVEKPHLILPSQQRLHKLRFLQKPGCQKFCWDQARLSSLVNKQVEFHLPKIVFS